MPEKPALIDSNAEMPTRAKETPEKEVQYAWVAGFMDGDGFISIDKCTNDPVYYQAKVEASQGTEDPLVRIQQIFGGSLGFKKNQYGTVYMYWRARGAQVEHILNCIYPYLVVKKRQAEIVMEFCKTVNRKKSGEGYKYYKVSDEVKAKRAEHYAENKVLNNRRLHAERLSERAPQMLSEDGAIVRAVSKKKDTEVAEMLTRQS